MIIGPQTTYKTIKAMVAGNVMDIDIMVFRNIVTKPCPMGDQMCSLWSISSIAGAASIRKLGDFIFMVSKTHLIDHTLC